MRIALVITGLELGGSETQLTRLAIGLHERKEDVLVLSLTPRGHFLPQLRKAGVRVASASTTNPFRLVAFVRKQLKEFQPDVAHSFLWHANVVTRLAAFGTGIPTIASYRGKEPASWRVLFDYCTRPLGDWTTTNSKALATHYRFSQRTTTVIQNGVPADVWAGKTTKPKPKTALAVGRLVWEKDYRTLIDAAKLAPDWTFSIAGSGPREDELKEYAKKNGVRNVQFLGQRNDVAQLLQKHQCLVHLAFTEGSPNAVIEAMLLGVPVIASDIPPIRELVHADGVKRGTLVPERDARAVVTALTTLPPHKTLTATAAWARKRFAVETMIETYRALYRSVIR